MARSKTQSNTTGGVSSSKTSPAEEGHQPSARLKRDAANLTEEEFKAAAAAEEAHNSKSAKKREADALKALGMQLAELSSSQLEELELPEKLATAVTAYQKITSNSAKRRQRQFIGGLLRNDSEEADAIRARYLALTEHDADAKRVHHALENWRERLIADDGALTEFLNENSAASAQELRVLIRRARSAKDDKQRKLATRALYRKLADIVQA